MAKRRKSSDETKAAADRQRERSRAKQAEYQAAGRDVGTIADIKDPVRRESCRYDLKLFFETYNPKALYLDWAAYHDNMIRKLEECILTGAIYAYACPRGGAKTAISKIAALWGISYGHVKYIFMIGATAGKGEALLSSVKMWMRFLPDYIVDFPEISQCVRELKGKGNAATGQLCGGESTLIQWSKEELVLPTVPPPSNLDLSSYDRYLQEDGTVDPEKAVYAPTAGSRIKVSGLTGEGIRGAVETTIEGHEIRPDVVLLDDPQTDVSAGSRKQNQDRYELVTGAVLGMAGPAKKISLMMPCTVIKPGDMVSVVLDRKRNPLFRGDTVSMLDPMPSNLEPWEKYFEVYEYCAQLDPPDYTKSNEYYIEHREELDQDAVATWEERFNDDEVSAIQSAMHLYFRDPKTFFAEYQNNPQDKSGDKILLTADEITKKQSNYLELECPIEVEKITAFVDVQSELLYYGIVGWDKHFGGHILKYSTYPEQQRVTFFKQAVPVTLEKLYPDLTPDARTRQALKDVEKLIMEETSFRRSDNKVMNVDYLGYDQRYKGNIVRSFIREAKDSRLVPCFGGKWTGEQKPMNHPDYIEKWTSDGRRLGHGWRQDVVKGGVQPIEVNPNIWKTMFLEGLATPSGERGCITLYAQEQFRHSLFASHLTAEYRDWKETRWGKFDIYKVKPGNPDNDWLDVMYNCCMLASFAGIEVPGVEEEKPVKKKRETEYDWAGWD